MFANVVARLGSLFAQPGAQAIAAGLLTGTIAASVLLGSGVFSGGATAAQTVALLACPGTGPVLARIAHNEQTLVTARSANGEWLEVYLGEPGIQRAWAPAQALRLQSGVDRLPIHDCSAPVRSAAPTSIATLAPPPSVPATVVPSPTATPAPTAAPSAAPSPTPRPTRTLKPTPTPFVDKTAPVLSNLTIKFPGLSGGKYTVYNSGSSCAHFFKVEVSATDPDDAVSGVTFFWQGTNETALSAPMVFLAAINAWQYTATLPGTWDIDDVVTFWVRAVDTHGNQSANLFNDPASQHVVIDFCPAA